MFVLLFKLLGIDQAQIVSDTDKQQTITNLTSELASENTETSLTSNNLSSDFQTTLTKKR